VGKLYILLGVLILVWLLIVNERLKQWAKLSKVFGAAIIAVVLVSICVELPYWRTPSFPQSHYRKLYVIGDSISAGLLDDQETWPKIIAEKHGISVVNLARAGATVESAFAEIDGVAPNAGGNDLFKTPRADFEARLGMILNRTRSLTPTLVMLELPLPPFCNSVGRIQRKLASKYDAILIPKHFFAQVACSKGATRDGLHLSRDGHQKMADTIWNLIQPLFHKNMNFVR